MNAYLVLVTWPDGRVGLLFPRPGNVAVADTVAQGEAAFLTAKQDLLDCARLTPELAGTTIRLIRFARMETLREFKFENPEEHEHAE